MTAVQIKIDELERATETQSMLIKTTQYKVFTLRMILNNIVSKIAVVSLYLCASLQIKDFILDGITVNLSTWACSVCVSHHSKGNLLTRSRFAKIRGNTILSLHSWLQTYGRWLIPYSTLVTFTRLEQNGMLTNEP